MDVLLSLYTGYCNDSYNVLCTAALDKSFTGFAMAWVIGPYAFAFASLCVGLYSMFPAFKSGNTKRFASPDTLLPGAFDKLADGTSEPSACY
jgi:hypothetical protein